MDKEFRGFINFSIALLSIIFFIFLPYRPMEALEPERSVDQYLVDQWEISDGLPADSIFSIAQTPGGYLWIATSKGLARFDGQTFTTIPFLTETGESGSKDIAPDTLLTDKEGILWIGSTAGLTSYNEKNGQLKTIPFTHGIKSNHVRRMKIDMNGNLWISFIAGYPSRYSAGGFTEFNNSHGLVSQKVNAIVEDKNGNLLFGTREKGIFSFQADKFSPYGVPEADSNSQLGNAQIIHMVEDHNGELWIGTNIGLFHISARGIARYTTDSGLSDNYVTFITQDVDHNIWAGTVKGLNRIQKKGDGTFQFENLLTPYTITCIFEDTEQSLWVGTYDSGLKRVKAGKFTSYAPAHEREFLFSLFRDKKDNTTWIGALGGKLYRTSGQQLIESAKIPTNTGIFSIARDLDGNLWLGTNGQGVFKWSPRTTGRNVKRITAEKDFTAFTTKDGLADNLVTSIFRDSRGNLWFGTFDGVSVLYRDTQTFHSFKSANGLTGKWGYNVYEDQQHNIWIAADKGVTVIKDGTIPLKQQTHEQTERPITQNITHYLEGVSVTCIHEDRVSGEGLKTADAPNKNSTESVFWLATNGAGLKRLKNGTITSFTTAEGMASDIIYQFLEDRQGNFWMMSNSGILRVAKKELNRLADNAPDKRTTINCTVFDLADGIESIEFENELSRSSALKTAEGEFWFVTKKGITVVNPETVRINKKPPPVIIETVFFDQQPVPLHNSNETTEFQNISSCRFHFTAPTFLSPEKVKFKYRLEGRDREWTYLPLGNDRVAHYENLDPGTYKFNVIAANSEGVWNNTGATFTFTLTPSFYQTTIFKLLVVLIMVIAAALGFLFFYNFKKRLAEKEKQKLQEEEKSKKHEKYKGTHLDPMFAEERIKKLRSLMEVKKIYRDPDLSLQVLADKLSVTPHQLSRILNEKLNRSFSDYVNSYRVDEAKEILGGPGGAQQKVEVVAYEVGFNTMVAFYNAFKKYTKMTPAQYKKQEKQKKIKKNQNIT